MKTFTCLISDDRYSVPTLSLYLVTDPERVRELACRDLEENPHHERFEVHDGQELLFTITREESRS